jgi:Uma2 family endonuclease
MQVLEQAIEASFSPLLRHYSLQDFWRLPEPQDRAHYELIDGTLFMVPPPDPPHGSIDARLAASLHDHLTRNKLGGEVHHPREAIYTDKSASTYLEPDMMYVSEALAKQMGNKRTSADIVFEYYSLSSAIYDQTTKADTYLALNVRELWLVDSENRSLEVRYAREQDKQPYWLIHRYEPGEFAESEVLKGWRVSVDELFEGLL